jgi:hypothetical protein
VNSYSSSSRIGTPASPTPGNLGLQPAGSFDLALADRDQPEARSLEEPLCADVVVRRDQPEAAKAERP